MMERWCGHEIGGEEDTGSGCWRGGRMDRWMACRENSMVGGATWSQSGGEMHRRVTFLTLGVSVISRKVTYCKRQKVDVMDLV